MKVKYFADDGTVFDNEKDCIVYEGGVVELVCWGSDGERIANPQRYDEAFFCEIPSYPERVQDLIDGGYLPRNTGRYIYFNDDWTPIEEFEQAYPFKRGEE